MGAVWNYLALSTSLTAGLVHVGLVRQLWKRVRSDNPSPLAWPWLFWSGTAAFLAFFYSLAYTVLIWGGVDAGAWTATIRPVAVFTFLSVWALPAGVLRLQSGHWPLLGRWPRRE